MTEISIFTNKEKIPENEDIKRVLGNTHPLWKEIQLYVVKKYPGAIEEWNFPGKNYGWSFRIKDKKRAIIYLLPRSGFFKAAFVFGERAIEKVMASDVNQNIKKDLQEARKYAEGRGIRIEIREQGIINDIKKLVDIKLAN